MVVEWKLKKGPTSVLVSIQFGVKPPSRQGVVETTLLLVDTPNT